MGLNISPAIWQSYISAILDCLQNSKYCEAIMDDLLLFTPMKCYVMQAVVSVSCLRDKSLFHAKLMSTALTQLLIFRFSCLLTNKGIAQCIDNSN